MTTYDKHSRKSLEIVLAEMAEPFRQCSDNLMKTICFTCRNGICRDGSHDLVKVGWKLEYPKKKNVKAWKKLKLDLQDETSISFKRARPVVHETDNELFTWAHLYNNSNNTPRIKFPRKRQWITPSETAMEN